MKKKYARLPIMDASNQAPKRLQYEQALVPMKYLMEKGRSERRPQQQTQAGYPSDHRSNLVQC
jgi:hypothetical protein